MKNKIDKHSRSKISEILNSAHLYICRAGFLIVAMTVKRNLLRAYIEEAQYHLAKAQEKLKELESQFKN